MIKFNTLLRDQGIDPSLVKLVRHQDTRFAGRPSPYELWQAGDGRFELYQRIQRRAKIFAGARWLAAFVATPLNETLFVGIYELKGQGKAPAGLIDPVSGLDAVGADLYETLAVSALSDYRGRLLVAWGDGYRAWVQRAAAQDKTVIELRRAVSEPPFPGYLSFCERLSGLRSVPLSWRQVLASVGGVYLLVCPTTGRHYVGSAGGAGGFWGRWENYVSSGHGGNRRLIDLPPSDYQVTILEIASANAGQDVLLGIESRWKRKLLTREFGLNAN